MAGNTVVYNLKLNMGGFNRGIGQANNKVSAFGQKIKGVRRQLAGLGVVLSGVAIAKFGNDVIQTTATMESLKIAIDFASGSAQEGAKSMAFLRDTSKSMGINLFGAIQGFKQLASSALGTSTGIDEVRQIFGDVSVGISALGLSAAESKRIFLALGQMLSKGTVAAEELRRQLGDTLPGTMSRSARSMGITVAEFVKLLESGQIKATEFVSGFAKSVREDFEGALPRSTKALRAEMNKLSNAFFELKNTMGSSFSGNIKNTYKNLAILAEKTEDLVKWLTDTDGTFRKILDVVIAVSGAFVTYKAIMIASLLPTIALTVAGWGLTAAFGAMSAVLLVLASPITMVALALAGLAAGFIYAYRRSLKFRAALKGLGKVFIAIGERIGIISRMVLGFMTVNPKMIAKAQSDWKNLGETVGEAYSRGFRERVNNEAGIDPFRGQDPWERVQKYGNKGGAAAGALGALAGVDPATDDPTKNTPSSVSAAGIKTFNINIDKLIGTFMNQSENLGTDKDGITKTVTQVLMEALADVQTVASNV